jgi:hypothetical protein
MTSTEVIVTAYTTPDVHSFRNVPCHYDRVLALRTDSGDQYGQIEDDPYYRVDEHRLAVSPIIGQRMLASFELIAGKTRPINCHGFARVMVGLPTSTGEPKVDFSNMSMVDELLQGAVGVIGVTGEGVVHSIGYGMGRESLQDLSCFGEFGIADNGEVVSYYRRLFPGQTVGLYQLPIGQEDELLATARV